MYTQYQQGMQMIKFGARDQSGKKKKIGKDGKKHPVHNVAALSNEDIIKKEKFRPREYSKVERVLAHRGLTWA